MKPLKLDLRKTFRALGKAYQARFVSALSSIGGPPIEGGGPKAGSLPRELAKAKYLSVKRWGYVLKVHSLGQKLTWLVRGTVRQPARHLEVPEIDADHAASVIGDEIARVLSAWDLGQSRRTRA